MSTKTLIDGRPVGKWKASILLFKETWRFMMADKELLLVPIFSALASILIVGLLSLLLILSEGGVSAFTGSLKEDLNEVRYLGFALLVFIACNFVVSIATAVTTHIVYVRAHSGDATLGQGIARALGIWRPLLLWSFITSSVGLVLNAIAERSEFLGKLVASLLGAAWSIMTFFAVPIMLIENKSAVTSIKDSASLFRKTWGETLISNVTLGLAFLIAHLVVIASFVGLLVLAISSSVTSLAIVAIFMLVLWFIVSAVLNSAMQGVLRTLLYIYSSEGISPTNFNPDLLHVMLRKSIAPVSATTMAESTDVNIETK